jgi:molybdopterin-biosynthesis enzyme MoeA-like protein
VTGGAGEVEVEVLAAGTELLAGEVLDTDTRFLARTATDLGAVVTRALLLPDDPAALEEAVRASLARAPRGLFTCGGLGPPQDDRTLAAVAAAAGVPLVEHPAARTMVAERYAALAARGWVADGALGPERLKMALLPRGARPFANPVGAAPAVVLPCGGTTVISLPGVPAELEAIVAGPLRPDLVALLGSGACAEDAVLVATGDESALAPAVAEASRAVPSVRIKSRARRFGPETGIKVTLSARGKDPAAAAAFLAAARAALAAACAARGLAVGP